MDDTKTPETTPTARTLSELLLGARTAAGLELAEVAQRTHIRREYLKALDEGRYEDLPEDVYTRNFVRLYAQAVGASPETALELYRNERRDAVGMNTIEVQLERDRERAKRERQPAARPQRAAPPPRRGPALGSLLTTLLLVAGVVALAVWGYNTVLFKPNRAPQRAATTGPQAVPVEPATPPAGLAATPAPGLAEAEPETGEARTVRLSISSEPPGAEVFVDQFPLPGVTPISSAPVTAREGRVVRVALDGYEPVETRVDLTFDRNLSFALTPVAPPDPQAAQPGEAGGPGEVVAGATAAAGVAADEVTITVSEPTWLEVYQGTARNQGERLVYTTANPGQSYTFVLPIYVHAGNASGVRLAVGGQDRGQLGSTGEVVGRAVTR